MSLPTQPLEQTALQRAQYYRQISSRYTQGGVERVKRHLEYGESPETISSATAAVTTILMTGLIGAKAGKEIGKSLAKTFVSHETDGDLGSYIGGGTGFIVGACTGAYLYMTAIEETANYKAWVKLKIDNTIQESITLSYSNDPILANYCCPVSLCIMNIPAYTPSGGLYDFAFLLSCPHDLEGKIKDPNRNASFHENEIVLDIEMAFFIKKRIQFLIKKDLEYLRNDPEIKKSLEKELRDIEKTMVLAYEKARDKIEERRRSKIVTPEAYENEMLEFKNIFGADENKELDWTLDWATTLKQRFKFFNPTATILI